MKELMPLDNVNPVKIFSEGGLDDLLAKIEKEAKSHIPDLESDKGRKAIASMAAKVAKSKTYLDGLGKELVSGWKNQAKVVDNERKKMRDTLDDIKAEVRKPLTDWEDEEKLRVSGIQDEIETLHMAGNATVEQFLTLSIEAMKDRLLEIQEQSDPKGLEEYAERYNEVKLVAITKIKESINMREKHDSDQKELEDLRLEKEERDEADRLAKAEKERAEREEKIAKDAADKAENAAAEEIKRVEAEKQDAIQAKKDADERTKQAEKQAKIDSDNAAQAERDKIEAERLAEIKAAEKREANKKHSKKINNEAKSAIMALGVDDETAIKIVTAIAKGKVPNVKITY